MSRLYTREERREAVTTALVAGAMIAACVALVVGIGLHVWLIRNHERLAAEARQNVELRLRRCQAIGTRLAIAGGMIAPAGTWEEIEATWIAAGEKP